MARASLKMLGSIDRKVPLSHANNIRFVSESVQSENLDAVRPISGSIQASH